MKHPAKNGSPKVSAWNFFWKPVAPMKFKEDLDEVDPRQLREFDQLLKLYDIFRNYMRVEHTLQNERSTWHNVIQGFLFATLGVMGEWPANNGLADQLAAERAYLPFLLAAVGIVIAILAWTSIKAADLAIQNLSNQWGATTRKEPYKSLQKHIPGIVGGGHIDAERFGKKAALYIPWIIIGAWLVVIGMFSWDTRHSKTSASDSNPCDILPPRSQDLNEWQKQVRVTCAMVDLEKYGPKEKDPPPTPPALAPDKTPQPGKVSTDSGQTKAAHPV
jgi:hypothetical protein